MVDSLSSRDARTLGRWDAGTRMGSDGFAGWCTYLLYYMYCCCTGEDIENGKSECGFVRYVCMMCMGLNRMLVW